MVIYSKSFFSGGLIGATALIGMSGAAQASLEICNDTTALQSVSVGYEAPDGWTSEGWWNVDPGECKTVVGGDLKDRYYYMRAEVKGGDFEGDGFYFCTSPKEFKIVGDTECDARDYDREDFIEIDAGEGSANYTYRMTDDNTTAIQKVVARGLIFCNETQFEQSVSIGYEAAEGWTSEGWWNIPAGECKTPLIALEQEYYYFRAEVKGVSVAGDGHFFCTTRDAYEIVGEQNCAARGYESQDFREIFVGANKSVFTYTIDTAPADAGNVPAEVPTPDPAPDVAPDVAGDLVGLEICNQTSVTQSVSIGYEGDEGFTSEGWWNVEPDACSKVIGTALTKQYYYYRAEVDGGDFDGDNAIFCTTPKAYTIVGDQNCEARGYDSEDFAELNIGAGTTGYRHTIGGVADALALLDKFPLPTETPVVTPVQTPSASGFQVCNETSGAQSFSIGYEGAEDWTSEGWWNVEPGACSTLIAGDLTKRYYYLRAEQDGGDFAGEDFYFCTTPDAYTIVGDQNCEARGYDRESFIEVDIGEGSTAYSYTLAAAGNDRELPAPDTGRGDVVETPVQDPIALVDNISDGGAGLEFCNDTTATQSISVGYEADDGWTSEGWWNVEPGACTTPALDGKNRRYFYYRAEVDGGEFDGQNYLFCTQPDAYTIVGDTNCAERGFDSEDFREIDTGGDTGLFTFTLVAAPSSEVVPAPGIDPNPPALTITGGGAEFDRSGESVQEAPALEPTINPAPEPTPDPAPLVVETPEPDPVVAPDPEPVPAVIPDPEPEPTGGGRRGGSRG